MEPVAKIPVDQNQSIHLRARGESKVNSHSEGTGFTLIELMVVVAVLAILASIALPTYRQYVQSARRADAQSAMVEQAQLLERYFTLNNSYTSATVNSTLQTRLSSYYTLSVTGLSATAYTVQAAPVAGSSQSTDSCGTMTLASTGAKTLTTSGCWK